MKSICFSAIVTFFSSAATAQETSDAPHSPPLLDQDKMYVEFFLGVAKQEMEDQQGVSFPSDSFSLGLRSGYSFNQYLAAELGYSLHGTGEAEEQGSASNTITSKISSASIDAGFKATLPLSDQFFLNARAGMANWSYEIELTDTATPNAPFTGEDSGYDPYYGGSLIYKPNETFYLGLEYTAYEFDFRIQGVERTHSINTMALLFGAKI